MACGRRGFRVLATGLATCAAISGVSGCGGGEAREDAGAAPAGFAPPAPAVGPPPDPALVPRPPDESSTTVATVVTTVAAPTPAPAATAAPGKTMVPVPTTTLTPTTTVDPDLGNVTMAFTGDALWHSPLWGGAQQAFAASHDNATGYDFAPMLASIAPLVSGVDLGVCHLETPIAPEGEQFSTFPNYGVPPEVAGAIVSAGFDRCSTASNHTLDRGVAGIDRTVNVLLGAGLGQSGMARTPEEIAPAVFLVDGVAIAHLSYTFSYNGKNMPPGEEWRSALIDPDRIVADSRTAESLGAELVVVSMHWGNEGSSAITAAQREAAEQITASGAVDLIVGHHAHVVQPIEQVNGVWVIFGLGNMISNMPTGALPQAATQDGAVATIGFQRRADGGFDISAPVIHPTWVDRHNGWIVRLVQPALADPAMPDGLRGQLEASLARTQSILGPFISPT